MSFSLAFRPLQGREGVKARAFANQVFDAEEGGLGLVINHGQDEDLVLGNARLDRGRQGGVEQGNACE